MARFDVFGAGSMSLEEAREVVERGLGIRLEPHDSGYLGEYYCSPGQVEENHVSVQTNFQEEEDGIRYYAEQSFPEHVVVVYLSHSTDEMASRLAALDGLVLLETSHVVSD